MRRILLLGLAWMAALLAVTSPMAHALTAPGVESEKPPVLGTNTQCRYSPTATHDFCGLPVALANFQGAHFKVV
jgi:hypothetical protein